MKIYMILIPVLLVVYFLTLDNSLQDMEVNELSQAQYEEVSDIVEDSEQDEEQEILVKLSFNGSDLSMNIDDYVLGVVACEVPASFNFEALKAMAVAVRTFYLYKINNAKSYVATNTDQCFNSVEDMKNKWGSDYQKYYDILLEAVNSTKNQYVSYEGDIIESFYFSMSNGMTENVSNVFSESRSYLVSVDSYWDKNLSSFTKEVTFSKTEFLDKLGLDSVEQIKLGEISRSESGRVDKIIINNKEFKGTDVRKKLAIRSTDFDIDISGSEVKVTTRGYGHGVGMSQYGANEMAKLGYTYEEILAHYYKGTELKSI